MVVRCSHEKRREAFDTQELTEKNVMNLPLYSTVFTPLMGISIVRIYVVCRVDHSV